MLNKNLQEALKFLAVGLINTAVGDVRAVQYFSRRLLGILCSKLYFGQRMQFLFEQILYVRL